MYGIVTDATLTQRFSLSFISLWSPDVTVFQFCP